MIALFAPWPPWYYGDGEQEDDSGDYFYWMTRLAYGAYGWKDQARRSKLAKEV